MIINKGFAPANNKEKTKEDLIQYIVNIEIEKKLENNDEKKLAKRLKERSLPNLTKKILYHLITRYEIDNNKLPSKQELVEIMTNFLGNIQKTKNNYNLKNSKDEIDNIKLGKTIGVGYHAHVYNYYLNSKQTKKKSKKLALKLERDGGIPYPIDVHITSAILLALYDFQPKYYNKYFMEMGIYENKSKQRRFKDMIKTKNIIENNIKFYILYNFTNISDQSHNSMMREVKEELLKIDIRRLNSEKIKNNMVKFLDFFDIYKEIFLKYKDKVIKELNKILLLDENFLIDLIIFRTERGCFNIPYKELEMQIDCISSSYKVLKITKDKNPLFRDILFECKKKYKDYHL